MNSEPKYIAYDTETGGTDPSRCPILTGYFVVLSEDLVKLDELNLKIKPEAPFDLIENDALKITGIDIAKHLEDSDTISRQEAGEKLRNFVLKYKPKGRSKLIRMGYNIGFDDKMIISQLVSDWEKILHYRTNDIFNIVNFLKDVQWLPSDLGSLTSVVNYFNISLKTAHDAKNDVWMSIAVYDKLKDLMEKSKQNDKLSLDVLEIIER
jgi:DNA polymerase III epsilon subunit-like protein